MSKRRSKNKNLVSAPRIYGTIPAMSKVMKYVYNGGSLRSITWQYGDGHADFEFGDVGVYGMTAMGNANNRQFIQNQYAMFIINKVDFFIDGLEINRYYDMDKLEKTNGVYSDLRVDPLFSQDSVLISTYFVNNHGSFGQPLLGVAYEGVTRYRLKNGLRIKHTYYPRNKNRIEKGMLNSNSEINKLCKAMGTPDVVNNDHAARTYIGFDSTGFPTKDFIISVNLILLLVIRFILLLVL